MLMSPKTSTFGDRFMEKTLSILDETESKTMHWDEEGGQQKKKKYKTDWSKASQKCK